MPRPCAGPLQGPSPRSSSAGALARPSTPQPLAGSRPRPPQPSGDDRPGGVAAAGGPGATGSPPRGAGLGEEEGRGCFRLRRVVVDRLLSDGSLGLLLHGTSLVGFCSPQAEACGWAIGDQIVEVNGARIAVFDEFLDRFMAAQERGLPIEFGVLRREFAEEQPGKAEAALDGFFDATDLTDLAGQLHRKFGCPATPSRRLPTPCSSAAARCGRGPEGQLPARGDSDMENPYVQALRKRRDELKFNADKWMCEEGREPLAARLATRRSDALATLTMPSPPEPRRGLPALAAPLALAGCMAGNGRQCSSHNACVASYTVQPTPRVDLETDVLAWALPEAWREESCSSPLGPGW